MYLNVQMEILVANCHLVNGDAALYQKPYAVLMEFIAVQMDTLVVQGVGFHYELLANFLASGDSKKT